MFGGGRGRVATAQLTLNVSQFQRAAQVAITTAKTLSTSVQRSFQTVNTSLGASANKGVSQLAQGFREATRAAQEFSRTDLGRVAQGLGDVEKQLRGISVAAGLVSALGVKEAQNLLRQNALLKIFSRTQEGLLSNQQQIRDFAEKTSQSYLTTLESANAILPTVNRFKIDLGGVLSIIQRLAILDPAQGIQGAAFAIREALSGQGRSLAARFELSLSEVNGIIRQGGSPDGVIKGLGALVDRLGLTEEAFLELQNSGVNTFERLTGTLREALGTAFTPFLTRFLIPLADKFNAFVQAMNRTNPGILALAAGGTLVVAAFSPLLFILPRIITLIGTIATFFATGTGAAILAGLKTFAVGIGGAVASVAGGVVAGAGVAQLAANAGGRSGDLGRIASRSQGGGGENVFAVLAERIKQLMFITINTLAAGLSGLVATLKKGAAYIQFAFENLDSIFKIGATLLTEGFFSVVEALGGVLVQIASVLGVFGGEKVNALGEALQAVGAVGVAVSQSQRGQLEDRSFEGGQRKLELRLHEIELESQRFLESIGQGTAQMFGFVAETTDEATKPLSVLATIMNSVREAATGAGQAFANALPILIEGQAKANEMRDEFTQQRTRKLESRGIEDARQAFDDILSDSRKVADFWKSLAEDQDDFNNDQLRKARDFAQTLSDEDNKTFLERAKINKDYSEAELKEAEDNGRKLARIERETRENVQKAARRLDASGVSEAYRNGQKQIDDLNEQSDVERKQRQKDYAEKLVEFDAQAKLERDQRIRDFNIAQADAVADFNQKRQRRIQEFQQELRDEAYDRAIAAQRRREDRAREDRMEVEDYNKRIAALWQTVYTESMLWGNLREVVAGASNGIRASIASIFTQTPLNVSTNKSKVTGTKSSFGSVSNPIKGKGYAMGGTPPLNQPVLVGERGIEIVQFTSPARIHSSESSATRGMLNGGGASLQIGTFSPTFGIPNLDSVALELHQRIEDTITQFALDYASR